MDPVVCLNRLALAVNRLDCSEAVSALNDYYKWRVKGGFEPSNVHTPLGNLRGDVYADILSSMLADKVEQLTWLIAPEAY